MEPAVKLVSLEQDPDGRRVRPGEDWEPVGVTGTVVVLEPEEVARHAVARMPDGALLNAVAGRSTPEGYELVFDRPLPPGTRMVLPNGDTIIRLE